MESLIKTTYYGKSSDLNKTTATRNRAALVLIKLDTGLHHVKIISTASLTAGDRSPYKLLTLGGMRGP